MLYLDVLNIGAICSAIIAVISLFKIIIKLKNSFNDLEETQTKALICIIRELLIVKTDRILSNGEITNEEFNTLSVLMKRYTKLGGNGTMCARVDKCISLPIKHGMFDKKGEDNEHKKETNKS